jgi:hypothetical protein
MKKITSIFAAKENTQVQETLLVTAVFAVIIVISVLFI